MYTDMVCTHAHMHTYNKCMHTHVNTKRCTQTYMHIILADPTQDSRSLAGVNAVLSGVGNWKKATN